jgi:1-acyl-sn-glycerol-3-phosphate acyltransferase
MPGVTWVSRLVYTVLNGLMRAALFAFTRWDVSGAERVPADGPVILVANHNHLADPPLVAASCRRQVHPMAKRELFEIPLIGWAFWLYGAFPVRRFSADMGALRVARNHLRAGRVVLMFPEGTRAHGKGMRPALPGAAMVALLTGAPIVPIAITGTDQVRIPGVFFRWLLRRRLQISVTFGEPFALDGSETNVRSAEQSTDLMMRRVAAMLPEHYRGAYGDHSAGTIVVARQLERERRD